MAGGLLQIIAYGIQDLYLTNDPQITFFKVAYRRHTNFSIQTFERTINEGPDFGKKSAVKIYRLGDLATKMFLRVVLSSLVPNEGAKCAWVKRLGHAILKSIEITIGGQPIDKQYGTWLDIWYELARQGKHEYGYAKLIGDVPSMTNYDNKTKPQYTLYIPLKFWFNRHHGLALPLISIQYHDIYLNIEFEEKQKLLVRNNAFDNFDSMQILDAGVLIDYIYLDMMERRKFATHGHEYLIEKVQYAEEENVEISTKRLRLTFNHPTKEIIWAMRNGIYTSGKHFLCYTNEDDWSNQILTCSQQIISESIILNNGSNVTELGRWEKFPPSVSNQRTSNNKITIQNKSKQTLWFNVNSLMFNNSYNLTDKLSGTIAIDANSTISISNVSTELTERDISIPLENMTDTRISSDPIIVYQFSNYGILITGKINPLEHALLEYNAEERFIKRNGDFFNYLHPQMHHSNQPADGINVYSFAIFPEQHQPSGASNLSKIENIIFTLWFGDNTNKKGKLPLFNIFNLDNRLFIYAYSYNILRVMSGLTTLIYTD